MERVYYYLERSLPALQLLDTHKIVSDQEANAITTQRNRHERNLIRRHARPHDFIDYVQWEGDVHELISLRIAEMDLPPSLSTKIRAAYLAHAISIFERAIRRLKYDIKLWISYIYWSIEKGMRKVAARVMARALSLHPSHVPLWISAASFELNSNGSPTAARTLLLRGIRMNRTAWRLRDETDAVNLSHGNKKRGAGAVASPNPAKRAKSEGSQSSKAAVDAHDDPSIHPARIDTALLRLWIEYFRMELVFLERLRRRKMVLGLDGGGSSATELASAEEKSTEDAGEAEDLAIQAVTVPADVAVADDPSEAATAAAASAAVESRSNVSILDGAIPIALLHTAVGLSSDKAFDGLPPDTHFAFLLSVLELLREFPLLPSKTASTSNSKLLRDDKSAISTRLLEATYDALAQRFPNSGVVSTMLACRSLALAQPLWTHVREESDELSEHTLLHESSQLQATFSRPADGLVGLLKRLVESGGTRYADLPMRVVCLQLRAILDATSARAPSEVPSLVQEVLGSLDNGLKSAVHGDEHFISALEIVESLRFPGPAGSSDVTEDPLTEMNLQLYIALMHARILKRGRASAGLGTGTRAIDMRWQRAEFEDRLRKIAVGGLEELMQLDELVNTALLFFVKAQSGLVGPSENEERLARVQETEKLWDLRLRIAARTSLDVGKMETMWSRILEECPTSWAIWSRWVAWVDERLRIEKEGGNSRKGRKWALGMYEAAVQRTAAQLSLSSLAATRELKQAIHDLVLERYLSCAGDQYFSATQADAAAREKRDASFSRAVHYARTKAFGSTSFWLTALHNERVALGLDVDVEQEDGAEVDAFASLASSSLSNLATLYSTLAHVPPSTPASDIVKASLALLRHLLLEKQDAAGAIKELHRVSRSLESDGKSEDVKELRREWGVMCGEGQVEIADDDEEEGS